MQNKIQYMIGIIFLGLFLTDCSYNTSKRLTEIQSTDYSFADSLWIDFRDALLDYKIDYLISNSFDSIQCTDCLPDSLKTKEEIYNSKLIFSSYLRELIHLDNLKNYKFTTLQNDTMIFVSYIIKCKQAEEGAYSLHYRFKKDKTKYLFQGMITTP